MKKILSPEEREEKRLNKVFNELEKDSKLKSPNEEWKTKYAFADEILKERLSDESNKMMFEIRGENRKNNSEYNYWRIQAFWYKQGYKAAFIEEEKRLENIRKVVINASELDNERYISFIKSIRSFKLGIIHSIQDYNVSINKMLSSKEILRQITEAVTLNCKTYKPGDEEFEEIKKDYIKRINVKK